MKMRVKSFLKTYLDWTLPEADLLVKRSKSNRNKLPKKKKKETPPEEVEKKWDIIPTFLKKKMRTIQ